MSKTATHGFEQQLYTGVRDLVRLTSQRFEADATSACTCGARFYFDEACRIEVSMAYFSPDVAFLTIVTGIDENWMTRSALEPNSKWLSPVLPRLPITIIRA